MTLIIGLPMVSFGRFSRTAKLNVAAKNVSAVLRLAKSYAVSAGSDYSFKINTTNLSEFWITDDAAAKTMDDIYELPATVTFVSATPETPITFKSSSGKADVVEITLENTKGDKKSIKVSNTSGKIIIG
jgi:Tfp pilus assembly protein FimT